MSVGLRQSNSQLMGLTKGFMVTVGPHRAMIYGGPYRQYIPGQRRLVGVKMAKEIEADHDIDIPTKDFSVPNVGALQQGLSDAIRHIALGNDVYVGCMGGIGRTGLFMGCLLKALHDAAPEEFEAPFDPVMMTRELYSSHAIETAEQMDYVREFPTEPVVATYRQYAPSLSREVVHTETIKYVQMSPWNSLKALLGFKT